MPKQAMDKELRRFGLLVGGIFGMIGAWPPVVRQEDPRWWAVVVGVLFMALGAVLPRSLRQIHHGWMQLGHIMGTINTKIILAVIYYALVTPMGLMMRLFGKDSMRRVFSQDAVTYRVVREPRPRHHMRNQF